MVPFFVVEAHEHRFHGTATVTLVSLQILQPEFDLFVHQSLHILLEGLYALLFSNLQGMLLSLGQQII